MRYKPTQLFAHCCLLALTIAFSPLSYAKSKTVEMCEQELTETADISKCFDGIRDRKDRELATWVNNQTFVLKEVAENTGRKAALHMFKRAQRNFISFRENNCRWQYLAVSPEIGAANAFKKCYIYITQDRINELKRIK